MHKPEKTIEQLARELKKYSLDAFMFVQECVGVAADTVHGRLDADQATVARWMGKHDVGPEQLGVMAEQGQVPRHIVQALCKIGGPARMNRHVTGQQLCWAIRDTALNRWGLMARGVLNALGHPPDRGHRRDHLRPRRKRVASEAAWRQHRRLPQRLLVRRGLRGGLPHPGGVTGPVPLLRSGRPPSRPSLSGARTAGCPCKRGSAPRWTPLARASRSRRLAP